MLNATRLTEAANKRHVSKKHNSGFADMAEARGNDQALNFCKMTPETRLKQDLWKLSLRERPDFDMMMEGSKEKEKLTHRSRSSSWPCGLPAQGQKDEGHKGQRTTLT